MYILVHGNGELSLQDCDNLRAFAIVMETADAPLSELHAIGEAADSNHYWLQGEAIEKLSPRRGDQRWIDDFRAMLASVADFGYYDATTNRVKAHLEQAHETN